MSTPLPGPGQICAVDAVSEGIPTEDGSLRMRRLFPTPRFDGADPFILMDHWSMTGLLPGDSPGVEPHPHCHIEVLTLVRQGALRQRASLGAQGEVTVGPGGATWLCAGAGVVHDERMVPVDTAGCALDAVQVWVALPKRAEQATPELTTVRPETVPVVEHDGLRARVLAGRALGVEGPAQLRADVTVIHATVDVGHRWELAVPGGRSVLVMVWSGQARIGARGRPVSAGQVAKLGDGTRVVVEGAGDEPADVLVLFGRPMHQPVVRFGPFIARDSDGIRAAMYRFQRGTMGTLTRS